MNEMIERVAKAIRDSFNSNDIDCYPIARAAIAAMREPYKPVIDFMVICEAGAYTAEEAWQAMIDAALKE
mgnify:CR=1 FL=1